MHTKENTLKQDFEQSYSQKPIQTPAAL